jgi:hypothetical protein
LSDLVRNYPVIFLPLQNNVEQSFGKDDNELKRIYTLLNSLRGWYYGGTPPTSPNVGDKWHDSATNIIKKWDGSTWTAFIESTAQLTTVLNEALGTPIASASTINLTTATGNFLHITGTTAITAVTLGAGMRREVIFDGVLTLTHHATNNNLPSAANITTAAGDRASYSSDGVTVYCTDYVKADGTPIVGGVSLASSAEAIAGTDNTKTITPLRLREGLNAAGNAPVYACRAWVNFNGTGTPTIRASGNVSSITDNGVGDYTVNFSTPLIDANYSSPSVALGGTVTISAKTSGAYRMNVLLFNSTLTDSSIVDASFFR